MDDTHTTYTNYVHHTITSLKDEDSNITKNRTQQQTTKTSNNTDAIGAQQCTRERRAHAHI